MTARPLFRLLLATPGILCIVVAVAFDYIGLGTPGSGFGRFQVLLFVIGLALLLCGVVAGTKRAPSVVRNDGIPLKRKLIYSGILTVVFAAMAFLALEFYVRVTLPHVDLMVLTGQKAGKSPMAEWAEVDPFCRYCPTPGNYDISLKEAKTVNQYGFISTPEINFEKEPGEIRLAFFGGSSTAGTGRNLPDEQTWPWKVAEGIRKRLPGRKVTFINAGVGGYSSFESYGRLWSKVRFFHPDIVILNHGWNEMYYFNDVDRMKKLMFPKDRCKGEFMVKQEIIAPKWMDCALQYSQALTRVRMSLVLGDQGEIGARQTDDLASGFDPRTVDVWRTNLKLFRETCNVLEARLFVCKQPTLMVPGLPEGPRELCHGKKHGFNFQAHLDAYRAIYETIDQEISASQVIDLTEVSGKPEFFGDAVHPTDAGTTAIADIVVELVAPCVEELGSVKDRDQNGGGG